MKSFPLGLICAAVLASPIAARALPQETVFDIVIPDGPDLLNSTAMGTMYVELDDERHDLCSYYAVWSSPPSGAAETSCFLDESKMRGHMSCRANSQAAFNTLVQRNAKLPCAGFDTLSQPQDLFMLVGMESASLTGIIGLIQFSAAAPFVYPFEAEPYP